MAPDRVAREGTASAFIRWLCGERRPGGLRRGGWGLRRNGAARLVWPLVGLLGGAAAVSLAGCAVLPFPALRGGDTHTYSEDQLRADLVSLANTYELNVSSAAENIKRDTDDRVRRENALRWQMVVLPRVRRLAFLPDPQQGYLAMAIVSRALRVYFEDGDGRNLFGDQQRLAIEASRFFEAETLEIGSRFLTPAQQKKLESDIDEIVRSHPIRGTFAPESLVAAVHQSAGRENVAWVVSLPMVPVRALTGVSDTAQAIHDFTEAARYLTDVAAGLPQEMRWQTELLLYDIEDRESVTAALSGWRDLSEAAQQLATTADRLPDELRAETSALFEDLLGQQAGLQLTLAEARAAIADAERALSDAGQLAAPYGTLASQVGEAGEAWAGMLREIRAMQEASASDPRATEEGSGFDVAEYEAAAREITTAAAGIRDILRELRALTASPELAGSTALLAAEIDRAEASGRSVVDHAAWRLLQLLGATLVGVAALRFASARWSR